MGTLLKVKCVDNRDVSARLTAGRTYDVVEDRWSYLRVIDDHGEAGVWRQERFEVVKEEEGPQPPEGNRQSILDEASKLIHGDRAADYGDARKMHQKIGDLWAAYLGLEGGLRADQVAMMMALMKISRSTSSPKFDTYVDLAGYAALGGEMAIQGQ